MTDLSKGRILVLGASGFIGRNLYEYFLENGYDVVGQQFNKGYGDLVGCDLNDYNMTKVLIKGFDYVFMAAAKTYGIGVCSAHPEDLVRESIIMNANVFHICHEVGVKKLMFISSSVVYQDGFQQFAEDDLDLNKEPFELYQGIGWVKRYSEKLLQFYNSLGLNAVIVRPTNVFGKYDKYEDGKSHFIPAIIKKCIKKVPVLDVWGSGNNLKDSIYIDDFVRDVVAVFKNYDKCDPVNICSGNVNSIKEIVRMITDESGYRGKVTFGTNNLDSVPYKSLIKNKFNCIAGKQKYTSTRDGLRKTIDWMRSDITGYSKY